MKMVSLLLPFLFLGCATLFTQESDVSARRGAIRVDKDLLIPQAIRDPKAINLQESIYLAYEQREDPAKQFFGNYVTLNINFSAAEKVRNELEEILLRRQEITQPLKQRGEAHITILTPPNYVENMKQKELLIRGDFNSRRFLKMKEFLEIAEGRRYKDPQFRPVCIGRGSVQNGQKVQHTYYIVVKAPVLVKMREEFNRYYLSRGGENGDFSPETYYPHITLGYTDRDLHEADGVIKDERSCIIDLI